MNDQKNSYDELAGEWAGRMKNKKNPFHEFLEKPAMQSKLPNLEGLTVLCIGCGSGEECQRLKDLGAAKVIGIDNSKGLIEQAKVNFPDCEFIAQDMQCMSFVPNTIDFAYSSLAMHYAPDWSATLRNVFKALKPSGKFLFSTHHPVKWAAQETRDKDSLTSVLGYKKFDDSEKVEVYGDYLNPSKKQDVWFNKLHVTYYHQPISDTLRQIREAGFVIADFIEPRPIESTKKTRPDFWELYNKIPMFMIFELQKPV